MYHSTEHIFKLSWLVLTSLIAVSRCLTYNSTALIIAVDAPSIDTATYILDGYGISYEALQVPQSGTDLPLLETSTGGNFGLFVLVSGVSYNGSSALSSNQLDSLYEYQLKYSVRMVHLDAIPSSGFGVQLISQCCSDNQEQNLTVIADPQAKFFPTAGLRVADLGTIGLYHYGVSILADNTSTTTAIANFQPNSVVPNTTIGAVINSFNDGREQMVFFMKWGNWSETSTVLSHAWVQWGYRGLYQGYRRIYFQTQVDDLFLQTSMYTTNELFRIRRQDLDNHAQWTYDINQRLNNGSSYFLEFGFNANGNLIYDFALTRNNTQLRCQDAVFTSWDEPTMLEYIKPLGSGSDKWPVHPTFDWTADCLFLDPLAQSFANTTIRDSFGLVSHTFTHLELDNATYHDALREIQFNLLYAELLNFTNAAKFSGSGLIPPAITGLHNGDAIRAWADNGLWNAIGDNTRPVLRNPNNYHWPLITGMDTNGFDGYQITPRFATRIYYNCDQIPCNVKQWVDTENGTQSQTIHDLLALDRAAVSNQLIGLFHDPYMFHQPNLRQIDVQSTPINGKTQQLSLIQLWVETMTAELMRVVDWPIISLKHDHIAMAFNQRMSLDACEPYIQYTTGSPSNSTRAITGFTVSSGTNNDCQVTIPVTFTGSLADTKGFRVEQIGMDPSTIWVKLDGSPQAFILQSPISL